MKASYSALPSDWPIALELIESGKVIFKPMISEIIALEDIQSAFQQLLKPDAKWVQVVVAFE